MQLKSLRWDSKPESSCATNTCVAPPGNDPISELEHKKYYLDFLCCLEKIVSWFLDFCWFPGHRFQSLFLASCSNLLRLAAILGRPTWSSSLWSWSFLVASESVILVFRRLKNFRSPTTSSISISVKNVYYILLCLFTVIYFLYFLCCINLVFYCLSVNFAMSSQSGSDGSTSSNSPTLVQANFANFEMLD